MGRGGFRVAVAMGALAGCSVGDAPRETGARVEQAIHTPQRSASAYAEAVRVKVLNADHDYCTGVIVAPRVVLTAAHCVIFNPGSQWVLEAPFAGGGAQTRTATSGTPIDPGIDGNYDSEPQYRDLAFLTFPGAGFNGIPLPTLSRTTAAAGTTVSAVGRMTEDETSGLVLSSSKSLMTRDATYTHDVRTTRITDGGDSGGPLFVDGTHDLVGTERLFTNGGLDYWSALDGVTYDAILAKVAANGGFVNVSPASATTAPQGSITFSVSAGAGPFTWSLATNASGGSISAAGLYRAGTTPSVTDVVVARDAKNNPSSNVAVTVGPGVTVSAATIAPLGPVTLAASGGLGPYTWVFVTNASGGSISAAGAYRAGATGSVADTVRATDTLGNTSTGNVTVGAAIAITPGTLAVPPRGAQTFGATGGSGSYTFALETAASGGSTGAGGAYTAGATPNTTDVVRVVDTYGAAARATVTVGGGVVIAPKNPSAPVAGDIAFSATGGSGTGFSWAFVTNASGGAITSGGAYHAGDRGAVTDVVRATDSLGNTRDIDVEVGRPITIEPPKASTIPPRGRIELVAIGGSGTGYVWSLKTNASGGTVDAAGLYVAGSTGEVRDVVGVTDSLGNTTTLEQSVGPGVTITPRVADLAPNGRLALEAAGGSNEGFVYAFDANASGATLDGASYTAGARAAADAIVVTDSLGNRDVARVNVHALVVAPVPAPTPAAADEGCGVTGRRPDGAWLIAALVLLLGRKRVRR